MSHQKNLTRIKSVHNHLGSLRDEVVFVGGATVSLYADRMAETVRPTEDVDILIEIVTRGEYMAIEEQLRNIGFKNVTDSKVICRYTIHGIIVDIMPTGDSVLGFSNKWYPEGYKNAVNFKIDDQHIVKIFSPPYFLASKLETFKSPTRKDNNNGIYSSDFEDIVFVLENRFSIWEELNDAPDTVRNYLTLEFKELQKNPFFEEWIDAHAGFGSPPATYYILDQLEKFTKLNIS